LPPQSGRDDYLIGIEIFDRRDGTPQLLSLRELPALTPNAGELAIVIGEGSAWVSQGTRFPIDSRESDGDFYQPVVNVFLLRRRDGKILTLMEEVDSFDAQEADEDDEYGEGDTMIHHHELSGTGHGTPWKRVMLAATIQCHSETRTKTLTVLDKPMGFSFEQASVDIERPGKAVTGVRIVMEDAEWADEYTCKSMEELLHMVETPAFALRWA
jgi:hypothetical protein